MLPFLNFWGQISAGGTSSGPKLKETSVRRGIFFFFFCWKMDPSPPSKKIQCYLSCSKKAFLHLLPDLQETTKNFWHMITPIPQPYRPSLNTWRPWTDLCLWNTIPISCFRTDKRQTVSPLAPPSFVRPLEEKSIYLWSRCLTFNLKI